MIRSLPVPAVAAVLALALWMPRATAQGSLSPLYDFVTLDYPGAQVSFPLGINNHGAIAGFWVDANNVGHGYLYQNGQFTSIDNPNAPPVPNGGTAAGGINDRGDITGTYFDKKGFQHGYLLAMPPGCTDNTAPGCQPVFSEIDVPGAAQTKFIEFEFGTGLGSAAIGINNHQDITGMYAAGIYSNGFLLAGGQYQHIDAPGADHTVGNGSKLFSLNDSDVAAGTYLTKAHLLAPTISHGFIYDHGTFTPVMIPGSEKGRFGTQANGINANKVVVGIFSDPLGLGHAFLWLNGRWFTLDYPKMPFSEAHSINTVGDVTGAYATDFAGTHPHGFLATPKAH